MGRAVVEGATAHVKELGSAVGTGVARVGKGAMDLATGTVEAARLGWSGLGIACSALLAFSGVIIPEEGSVASSQSSQSSWPSASNRGMLGNIAEATHRAFVPSVSSVPSSQSTKYTIASREFSGLHNFVAALNENIEKTFASPPPSEIRTVASVNTITSNMESADDVVKTWNQIMRNLEGLASEYMGRQPPPSEVVADLIQADLDALSDVGPAGLGTTASVRLDAMDKQFQLQRQNATTVFEPPTMSEAAASRRAESARNKNAFVTALAATPSETESIFTQDLPLSEASTLEDDEELLANVSKQGDVSTLRRTRSENKYNTGFGSDLERRGTIAPSHPYSHAEEAQRFTTRDERRGKAPYGGRRRTRRHKKSKTSKRRKHRTMKRRKHRTTKRHRKLRRGRKTRK